MQPEPTKQSEAPHISADAYNAVISKLVPIDLRLTELSFNLKAPVHSGPLSATAEFEMPEVVEKTADSDGFVFVVIDQPTLFKIRAADESVAAEGKAVFSVRLKLEFDPPEEFWPIFMLRNIKLYTHPALRDLIASVSARASLVVRPLGSIAVTQAINRKAT